MKMKFIVTLVALALPPYIQAASTGSGKLQHESSELRYSFKTTVFYSSKLSIHQIYFYLSGEECRFIHVSSCPTDSNLDECHKGMTSDELCEADKPLPDGNSNFEINNCGNYDVFKCSRGT